MSVIGSKPTAPAAGASKPTAQAAGAPAKARSPPPSSPSGPTVQRTSCSAADLSKPHAPQRTLVNPTPANDNLPRNHPRLNKSLTLLSLPERPNFRVLLEGTYQAGMRLPILRPELVVSSRLAPLTHPSIDSSARVFTPPATQCDALCRSPDPRPVRIVPKPERPPWCTWCAYNSASFGESPEQSTQRRRIAGEYRKRTVAVDSFKHKPVGALPGTWQSVGMDTG